MRKNFGFTLIELLVVIGVMVVVGTIGADLLMTTFKASNKTNITNQVRQNGSLVVDSMERTLRGGQKLYDINNAEIISNQNCLKSITVGNPGPPTTYTRFFFQEESSSNGFVALSTKPSLIDLPTSAAATDSLTNLTATSGVSLQPGACISVTADTSGKPPLVGISLSFSQAKEAPSRQDFQANIKFETTVSLRTY